MFDSQNNNRGGNNVGQVCINICCQRASMNRKLIVNMDMVNRSIITQGVSHHLNGLINIHVVTPIIIVR
jgi:hypothetical protein